MHKSWETQLVAMGRRETTCIVKAAELTLTSEGGGESFDEHLGAPGAGGEGTLGKMGWKQDGLGTFLEETL